MNIGVSASGFEKIKLDCGRDDLEVVVETEADFRGVIYTRGNASNWFCGPTAR